MATYRVPRYNRATGAGTLSGIARERGTTVADILRQNQGNRGIYYSGSDPRVREGAELNFGETQTAGSAGTDSVASGSATQDGAVRSPREYYSRLSREDQRLRDIVTGVGNEPELSKIRNELQQSSQGLIDAINAQYANTIAQERAAGDVRNQRTRALNVSSGLIGSDFASAAAQRTEDANLKVIQGIEQERDAKIAGILSGLADRASQQFEQQTKQYRMDAESALSARKEFKDAALEDAKMLALSGISSESLRNDDPDSWENLLKQTGYTDGQLTAYFAAQRPESEQIFKEKVGNQMIIGYRDPQTGKIITEKVPLAEGYSDFKIIGGKPYFVDFDGGKIVSAEGYTGSSSSSPTSANADKFENKQTENYYKTLPLDFRRSWEFNFGKWFEPGMKTSLADLQDDYKAWAENNPQKTSGGSSGGGIDEL